jgi:GT2 family glycosyltransferase
VKTFIIITTYNGCQWINKCLESTIGYPVVVVDNGSKDGTLDYIKRNHPEVNLIENSKNLGFGQANNLGIKYALSQGASNVFLLNQDAYLLKDSLNKLVATQLYNSEYGILSPIHLNGDGSRLDKHFSLFLDYNANPDFYSDFVLNKKKSDIYEVPFVNAAGWLISRDCLEKVGGFDPIFFHYGEDENYCQRVKFHQFKIGIVPDTFISHDRSNRVIKPVPAGSKRHYEQLERRFKIEYANINNKWAPELDRLITDRKSLWIKSRIKLKFRIAAIYKNEYYLFKRIRKEVKSSRAENKKTGPNYLSS